MSKNAKKWVLIAICILAAIVLLISSFYFIKISKEEKISRLLNSIEECNQNMEYDRAEEYFDQLDKLGYNTTAGRVLLEYDRETSKVCLDFYHAFENVYSKVQKHNYSSLRGEVDSLKIHIDKMDKLKIQEQSIWGAYIKTVQENLMYAAFKSEVVYGDMDLDPKYSILQSSYEMIVTGYMKDIIKIELPVDSE